MVIVAGVLGFLDGAIVLAEPWRVPLAIETIRQAAATAVALLGQGVGV